jgi:hypothetical protein
MIRSGMDWLTDVKRTIAGSEIWQLNTFLWNGRINASKKAK